LIFIYLIVSFTILIYRRKIFEIYHTPNLPFHRQGF